jgi:hypothetical protein
MSVGILYFLEESANADIWGVVRVVDRARYTCVSNMGLGLRQGRTKERTRSGQDVVLHNQLDPESSHAEFSADRCGRPLRGPLVVRSTGHRRSRLVSLGALLQNYGKAGRSIILCGNLFCYLIRLGYIRSQTNFSHDQK